MPSPPQAENNPLNDQNKDIADKDASATYTIQPVAYHGAEDEAELEIHEIDQAYLNASRFTKFYRGILLQMILFGALSLVGPSMNDAISNLGGGGLSTPYLANLATCLNYSMSCAMTLFGGPIINKVGIKWSCVIAGICMPLTGSAFYTQAVYKLDWYLLLARSIGGITSGFLYVAESTAMLSYPFAHERGKYLAIWAAMRNSGAVIGGGINFGRNSKTAVAGGIAAATYLIFVGFECTGWIWAFLLSPTARVRRYDGSRVPTSAPISWKNEMKAWLKHMKHPRTWLMFFPAFYSFFCGGVYGTYLSLHFSVRARALSSMLTPITTIVMVSIYPFILDNKRLNIRTRGYIAFAMWAIPQAACIIWVGIQYGKFAKEGKVAYDYAKHGARWAEAYLPYLIMMSCSYWNQLNCYWVLGTFSTDMKSASRTGGLFRAFETFGQAISYGINSNTGDKRIPLYCHGVIWVFTCLSMIQLTRMIPDEPAAVDDVAAAQGEAAREDVEAKKA